MLKLIIKHKIFEYALNNMFNKVLLNFKRNLINLKVGDKYKTITEKVENSSAVTYYNGEIIGIHDSAIGLILMSFEKYTYSPPDDIFVIDANNFEQFKSKYVEIDYHNKTIIHYPTPSSRGIYISMYDITSIVK